MILFHYTHGAFDVTGWVMVWAFLMVWVAWIYASVRGS